MSNSQQFDEHIKEQFNSYLPNVHPRIWENIAARTERRKPVGFWFSLFNNKNKLMLLGLLIAISTGGAWLYMNNGFTFSNTKITDQKNNIKDKNQSGLSKNELPGNTNAADQAGVTSIFKEDNTAATNNTSLNRGLSLSTPGGIKARIYSPSLLADDEQSTIGIGNTDKKKRTTGLGSVLNIKTESPDLNSDNDDFAGQGTLLGRLTFNAENLAAIKKKRDQQPLSFNPIIYLPGCPSIERDAAGNKKYIEIYGGPDYAFRSLSDTGNSVYLQKRKESEKFKSAFSAGIRYTKVFNNSMSVRGGFNYSQINEKFTFAQGNLVQITYIINTNGDTTGSYTTVGTRYKTTINKYRSIDVPIVVGYELGNGKLHANINAGIIVNVYSWQKGEVLDATLNPVNITTGKNSSPYQFKTNAGVGFIGAVSVYYRLTDKIHVMAEPYFRYNFTPMNKEAITLKQKYHTAGLRLGIRLDLK
ncbi:MAG: hypothetical protein ABI666_10875 [Ferruginibacter sp.]